MEINFKDFVRSGAVSDEPLDAVVKKINFWVADQGVAVINIETIMKGGSGNQPVRPVGFRVWYRKD